MPPRVAAVWVLTCLIWSTVWLFIKIAVTDVPPVTFAAVRLIIALAVMVPIVVVWRTPVPRRRRDWMLIVGTGIVLLGFNYALLNWGMQFISSGLTAVLQAMTPAFALVFAHLLLPDEKMTARKIAGLALGVVGVGVIFRDQLTFGGRAFTGSVAVTLGALCVAFAYVMVRREGRHLQPSVLTTGQMAAAVLPLMLYGWTVEGNPFALRWTTNALVAAVYLALAGSVLAAWLNYWLLARVGAVNLLVMGLIEPLIAILLGAWILGESMNPRALGGGALILLSVWLAMSSGSHPAAARPHRDPGANRGPSA